MPKSKEEVTKVNPKKNPAENLPNISSPIKMGSYDFV